MRKRPVAPADASTFARHVVNPWSWQDAFGFVHAHATVGAARTIFCAGQASVDGEGRPLHPGDMRAQVEVALDNLEVVLENAGASLGDVVRLNYYTTDTGGLLGAWDVVADRLAGGGCRPASTLLGVQSLALPDLLVEIEATAAVA